MSTIKEVSESKVTVCMQPKESFIQSAFKDLVTFSFIAFCIYISQGSTWWTLITGGMFLMFTFIKIDKVINKSSTTFDDADKAIDYLNKIKGE